MVRVNTNGRKIMNWVFTLSLFILLFSACKKEKIVLNIENPVVNDTPVQYDVPFKNVPNTADITMYEVNLKAFSSEGNLKGVQARLDSIKNIGINTIWIMPIYPIGELKGVGSPYSVRNYKQVNPDFGTLDDLRLLVQEAHKKDMAVILDWVANHTSWDNPWTQNMTWYTRDGSGNIVSPEGWNDVADLDYSSLAMRREMIKAMKYWVLTANVDGYRCDYADGVPTDFWKQTIDTLRNIPNRKIIMFAEGSKKELYLAGFNLIFGWNYYTALKDVFNSNANVSGLITANAADYSGIPSGTNILRFTSNHDFDAWENTPLTIFKGKEGSIAAFVLSTYMGGVPLIYNGQEVGCPLMLSFFNTSTTKIDWTINPEMKAAYKKIMAFRNSSNAVKNGSIATYNSNDIMAFKRILGTEEVLVIVNTRNSQIDFQLPASIAGTTWKNAFTGSNVQLANSLTMNPFAYTILKK